MMNLMVGPRPRERLVALSMVLMLHGGLLSSVLLHKDRPTAVNLPPLFVDFIEARPVEMARAAPQTPREIPRPAVTPVPERPKTPDRPQSAPLESTASREPASESAPVAGPVDAKSPVPPAGPPAAEGGGGKEGQARFDADYLKNPAPPYPPRSRRMGEEGKVVLRVQVSEQGAAEQVEIRTSSGSTWLDDSARRTVLTWRFVPARRGEKAVPSWVLVPIIFKLEQ